MDNYDIVEISGYWAWQFDKQADKLKSFDKCKDWRIIKPKKNRQKDICDCRVAFVTEKLNITTLSHSLTLGWQNEKQPSVSTELDLEAGNLVLYLIFGQERQVAVLIEFL